MVREILNGIYNYFFRSEKVEKLAAERKKICDGCMFNSTVMKTMDPDYTSIRTDEHCIECQCNLSLKQRSTKSSCPNKFW